MHLQDDFNQVYANQSKSKTSLLINKDIEFDWRITCDHFYRPFKGWHLDDHRKHENRDIKASVRFQPVGDGFFLWWRKCGVVFNGNVCLELYTPKTILQLGTNVECHVRITPMELRYLSCVRLSFNHSYGLGNFSSLVFERLTCLTMFKTGWQISTRFFFQFILW